MAVYHIKEHQEQDLAYDDDFQQLQVERAANFKKVRLVEGQEHIDEVGEIEQRYYNGVKTSGDQIAATLKRFVKTVLLLNLIKRDLARWETADIASAELENFRMLTYSSKRNSRMQKSAVWIPILRWQKSV